MIRQNILLSNANKSFVSNLNNDIYLNFPTNLFFKAPQYIELINLDLNAEINLFGYTNNAFYVIYNNITHLILVEYGSAIKTDYQLTLAVKYALNNPRDPENSALFLPYSNNDLIFDMTETSIENVVTNYKIERESFTTAYTIKSNNKCVLDFGHKDSIGPLIGFGNGLYTLSKVSETATEYEANGISTQSITAYNYIEVINSSGTTDAGQLAGPYPNYNDVNCKMVLYDSNKRIIPNKYKRHDTTISLLNNIVSTGTTQFEHMGEILDILEDQLNDYGTSFSPTAVFQVSYDNITEKITIKNTTGAKFGIGFDFNNITRERITTSTNGTSWISKTCPVNNDWRSVTYGVVSTQNVIVAVSSTGTNNRIMTTTDSINNWVSRNSPIDNYWSSLSWAKKINPADNSYYYIYVAVASSGFSNRVLYSSDGYTWNYEISPNNNWTSICYGGIVGQELFVAVASSGSGNRVMTSSNGTAWVSQVSASDNNWTSVCYGGIAGQEKFVAVASSGLGNRVMTSINGIAWVSQTSASNNNWTSICWSPELGLFVAVASSGIGNRVMTSSDGITWTSQISASDNDWKSIIWSPVLNLFVSVSSTGTGDRVMTSPNGINWTAQLSATDDNWNSITWNTILNKFIAITSDKTSKIMSSSDGISWTLHTISIQYQWNQIISTDTYLLACGNTIGISKDVYKWNNLPFLIDNDWYSVCWSSNLNLFVSVASSGTGNRVMTSSDSIDWQIRQSASDNNWKSVCWGGIGGQEKFVAVSSSGIGNRVMTSSNGLTWTSQVSASDNDWSSVCWSPILNLFVAVSSSGIGNRVMSSPDGIIWTSRASAADYDWTSICWGGIPGQYKFVAVASSGTGNRVMTSTNGINWALRSTPVDNNWSSVCWTGLNTFVAVASSGISNRIMTSSDGISWLAYNSTNNIDWNGVIWAGGGLDAVISVGSSFGNTSGSLHYLLGLEQKSYYDLTEIVSTTDIICYDKISADDFILVCSNILNNASDLNVIGIGQADNVKRNNIIFAIPLAQIKHFKPVDSSYYRINISSSNFSIGYKNKKFNDSNPNLINFYLRLLSGRHITCTSQYTMQISFLF